MAATREHAAVVVAAADAAADARLGATLAFGLVATWMLHADRLITAIAVYVRTVLRTFCSFVPSAVSSPLSNCRHVPDRRHLTGRWCHNRDWLVDPSDVYVDGHQFPLDQEPLGHLHRPPVLIHPEVDWDLCDSGFGERILHLLGDGCVVNLCDLYQQ
jgi:hypothetical protein